MFNTHHSNRIHFNQLARFFLLFTLSLLFISAVSVASASSSDLSFSTDLSGSTVPNGAVFLIVDGLGSYYLYSELSGETLSGESVQKARLQTLSNIWNNGFRVSEMSVPVPVTENGHSVLVTGNPKADSEMVGYSDASFLDILHQEGFICIGVMQRGDFESMRNKFDIIIYDKSNSVNNMDFTIQENSLESNFDSVYFAGSSNSAQKQKIIREINSVFDSQKRKASSYAETKDTAEKYAAYNRWGTDTIYEALNVMEKYPDQKFIIVANVGAIDSTGHYRGYYAYLDAIERLDKDLEKIYQKCRRNNLFFILTADHGMSFESVDKKSGGHSSTKYAKTKEALHIPFVIFGSTVKKSAVHFGESNQTAAAATLLSLFNIPTAPRFSQGEVLPAKELVMLSLHFPNPESVKLYHSESGTEVFNSLGFNRSEGYISYSISGLSPGNYLLKWGNETDSMFSSVSSGSYTQTELQLLLEKDTSIDLNTYVRKSPLSLSSESSYSENDSLGFLKLTKISGFLLIIFINMIGAASIYRIYRKNKSLMNFKE